MKVTEIGGRVQSQIKVNTKTRSEKSFSGTLDLAGQGHQDQQAKDMLEKIILMGKRLAASGNIKDIEEYRQAVKEYLSYVLNKYYVVKRQHSFITGNVLIRVENINREIAELTSEFLLEQRDNLKIVARVKAISGLLLDILR